MGAAALTEVVWRRGRRLSKAVWVTAQRRENSGEGYWAAFFHSMKRLMACLADKL